MFETILTSSVIAAIIAATVTMWTMQKRIAIENVTQDRRAWREKVRDRALAVNDALIAQDESTLNKLRVEFRAILNPLDVDHQELLHAYASEKTETNSGVQKNFLNEYLCC